MLSHCHVRHDTSESKIVPQTRQLFGNHRKNAFKPVESLMDESKVLRLSGGMCCWHVATGLCARRVASRLFPPQQFCQTTCKFSQIMTDKFTSSTVLALKLRAGTICSNLNCGCPTTGPHTDSSKAVTVGEAAHITAASPNGPRYDASLSPEERKSAANGIWLCSKCADLVDKDPDNYSVDLLKSWKSAREGNALDQINGCPLPGSGSKDSAGDHGVIPIPEQYRQRLTELIEINESNEACLTLQAIEHSNNGRLGQAIDIFTAVAYSSLNFDNLRVCWAFFSDLRNLICPFF